MLLAGEQQAAVTVAVEGLMDGKPLPELESFLTLDPKVPSPWLPSPLTGRLKSSPLLLRCYCTAYIGTHPASRFRPVYCDSCISLSVLQVKCVCSKCCYRNVDSLQAGSGTAYTVCRLHPVESAGQWDHTRRPLCS